MRWLCWFLPHKWVKALDPELSVCDRCDKLKRNSGVPKGANECAYPDCNKGWTTPPPYVATSKNGKLCWIYEYYSECSNCKRMLRWNRKTRESTWGSPTSSSVASGYWYGSIL